MPKLSKKKCSHPRSFRYYSYDSSADSYRCDLCGVEGLAAPERAKVIPDGIYKLNAPVPNPYGKDGRSNDWNYQSEIPTGTYYVTAEHFVDEGERYVRGVEIKKAVGSRYERVRQSHPAYDAMVEALVPVTGTDDEFIDFVNERYHFEGSSETVLAKLLKAGKITREDIEAAAQTETPEE